MTELVSVNHSNVLQRILHDNPSLCPPQSPYVPSRSAKVMSALRQLPLVGRMIPRANATGEVVRRLLFEQKYASSYAEWYRISAQLDELTGSNAWKVQVESSDYDYKSVQHLMEEMRNARLNKDYKLLLYLIRTKWTRNFGNMGSLSLYRHSHVGTKRLIEEYIEECQVALKALVHNEDVHIDDGYLLGMLMQTRKNIGRTALVLSGGSTFGMSHIGVLIALLENNLLPRVISGSSAGSVIASILCTHTNEETASLLSQVLERDFRFFVSSLQNDSDSVLKSILESISHFVKYGTVFDIDGVRDTVHSFIGDLTFREAYNRTGKILNITVSPASNHEQTRLLNYLTAPHCLIWSAVCASCSLPGIFPSNSIYEKNPATNTIREWNNDQSSKYVDGSLDGDLPIMRLSEMFNVDHIIAVQVNPHVSPVLKVSVGSIGGRTDSELSNTLRTVMNGCYDFLSNEVIHFLQILYELNVQKNFTSKVISLLTQRYSGDITILPELTISDFFLLFTNPNPKFILSFIMKGARAAWPKITVINNHCGVEFALDKEISALRGRMISNSTNRISYGVPISQSTSLSTSANSAYLVSSPVLHDEDSEQPDRSTLSEKHESRRLPMIRRHNSTGFPPTGKKKAFPNQDEVLARRKYTDSYLATPSRIPYNLAPSLHSEANLEELAYGFDDNIFIADTPNPAGMKKAMSSGNFLRDMRNTMGSVLAFNSGTNYEHTIHSAIDYDQLAAQMFGSKTSQGSAEQKEKANLPRLSKNNSLNNSGVGLNKLKESHKSSNGIDQISANNSSQNLKEYYNEQEQKMKSLYSPDLRRQYSRGRHDSDGHQYSPKLQKVSFTTVESRDSPFKRSGEYEQRGTPFSSDQESDSTIPESRSAEEHNDPEKHKGEFKPLRKTVSDETCSNRYSQ